MDDLIIKKESNSEVYIDVEGLSRSKLIQSLVFSLQEELDALPGELSTVSIFKISGNHKKSQIDLYTPHVVSIGPLHHGKSHIQAMGVYKVQYLQSFIIRHGISIDKLISYTAQMEIFVRSCYEDTSMFNFIEFTKMILLDGIFVVQLFVRNLIIQMREPGDMLFENQRMASDVLHDMLLLENQLPLNFILGLFEFVDSSRVHHKSFHELSCNYFEGVGNIKRLRLVDGYECSRHLVDFLLILHRPSNRIKERMRTGRLKYTRSASELQEAGVRFGNGMGNLFDVSYEFGLLTLPQLTVNDTTETFFRNLIAYEQCGHYEKHITSYVMFMNSLINTAEDVELLVYHGSIDNLLGENQLVADVFNNLRKEAYDEKSDFYFAWICEELNDYSQSYYDGWMYTFSKWKRRWLEWKLMLINRYFTNPWSAIGFLAAAVVVVLTVVQTVCAIIAL
ncbi:hypothetical protein POM88_018849 [Heracleum sosnowskyi]|uniref:Uncharacterized protein n=1 Tax=Heracleum sosnowskyi TaxID=360622 RepID=A0AAD8ITQ7_9APIA|nr:hypothetical protein POM88_018849 [Heracleum sosnowskyi]